MAKMKREGYIYNLISLVGILLAVVATGVIIALLALEAITGFENPYIGILTYFMLPGMVIFGLLLVPLGMYRVRVQRQAAAPGEIPPFPRIDLNDTHKRRLFVFFIASSVIFVLIITVATIKGYEFTESTTFCGELCHVPMQPEHTAWSNSPHANVRCVECHVGPGAKWYVKAKISGMRQLYAVAAHVYPTPIETPIENLRPSRDTCEHCHWPQKFYPGRQLVFYHYAPNEQNTPREINMILKIGVTPKAPEDRGIHGHIEKEVYYLARDHKRQDLPYIMVKERDGRVVEYIDTEKPITKAEIAKGEKRLMDCIDCHNRPTHIYRSPSREMDESFVSGRIDVGLPFMKKVAIDLLTKSYKSEEEAKAAIAKGIPAYYAANYPKLAAQKTAAIKQAVEEVQKIYGRNFFPKMKVSWNTYPDNIGHLYFPGCFRCHDGKHKSADGKVISKDCNLCHTVIGQKQENVPTGSAVTKFTHPVDIGTEIIKANCTDCHGVLAKEESGKEAHGKEH
ncbi:MAG TPA: NapC/NirT family cytochrome c [Geobacteraceae bacterium]